MVLSCRDSNVYILKLKCMQYWPDDDKMTYGSYTISVRKTIDCKDYVVRDMQLEKVFSCLECRSASHVTDMVR